MIIVAITLGLILLFGLGFWIGMTVTIDRATTDAFEELEPLRKLYEDMITKYEDKLNELYNKEKK